MNIDRTILQQLITERIPDLVDLIAKGLEATDTHSRSSSAALRVKIAHDADDEGLIRVEAATQAKRPRSETQDVCDLADFTPVLDYRVDEAEGQTTLADAVGGG